MTDAPLANAPEARTETGEIKDVSTTTPSESSPSTTPTTSTETTPATPPKEGEKPPEAAKAPEKYEDFKLPDGVELKGEQLTVATALFKEMNLPQGEAQKLVDFHVAQVKAALDAPAQALKDMRADWQSKTNADPDLAKVAVDGKTGMDAVKINIAKLYSAVGNESLVNEFKEIMNLTGVGDNRAFISVLNKLAGFVIEGKHVTGGQPSPHGQSPGGRAEAPSAAQALYLT